MKAKVSSISAIICLITLLFFCILACDNGSASSSASNTDGLVKVSLSVAGDSVGSQKSISVDSSLNPANFKYFYKAVPKWTQNRPIHGSTNDQFILIPNYSAGANIGYFTAGEWQFFVQIRNGSTVVYEGSTNVTVVSDNFAVNVLVNKIIQAASGSVSVTVTAPTVASEAMTVAWSGTASGSGAATATPLGDGTTRFTFTKNDFSSGYYTFTLNHSSTGSGAAIAVDLSPGERADITGHLENGTWQVGYITVKIYSINVIATGCTVQSNVTAAAAGEKVSFYITPYAGSVFDDLTVEWAGGDITPVPVAGLYTFEMPAGDVDLTATYSSARGGGDRVPARLPSASAAPSRPCGIRPPRVGGGRPGGQALRGHLPRCLDARHGLLVRRDGHGLSRKARRLLAVRPGRVLRDAGLHAELLVVGGRRVRSGDGHARRNGGRRRRLHPLRLRARVGIRAPRQGVLR